MSDVTQILSNVQPGASAEELLPLVYAELRKLAAAKLAQEKPGQTLQATALVHEAYARLVGGTNAREFHGRGHFFAAAAEAMRRILVDAARRKAAIKHGGATPRADVDVGELTTAAPPAEILAVHEALDRLAACDPQAAELVKLHYFSGFSLEEAAELLGISRAGGYRLWNYARAWLRAALQEGAPPDDNS